MNMTLGKTIASRSKLLKANNATPKKRGLVSTQPVMIYVDKELLVKWEEFAYDKTKSKSAIAREALEARLNGKENDYTSGFNAGLSAAVDAVGKVEAFKMRFPSGKSFADLLVDEVAALYRDQTNE